MRQRKIGTLGKDFGRHRKVQKHVLGGDGLPRVGSDGFQSILDAGLDFAKLHFDDSCALRGQDHVRGREASNQKFQNESFRAEPRLRRPPCPAGWF